MIAFLLPDSASSRWEDVDRTEFQAAVEASCADCVVKVYNAGGDADTQQDQLGQAKEDDADVFVLAAVDTDVGESMVEAAGETPVIAYDRFINGADYHVSFDGSQVGALQAEALLKASRKAPRILMLNGGVGDTNATAMKLAAHKAFDDAGVEILAEEDLAGSDPARPKPGSPNSSRPSGMTGSTRSTPPTTPKRKASQQPSGGPVARSPSSPGRTPS